MPCANFGSMFLVNLNGVDVDWVREQLQRFIEETQPVNQSNNMVVTARTAPACGRPRAIELVETARPILTRLYPEWRSENPTSSNDEFRSERDAARRLLARLATHADVASRLGSLDTSPRVLASSMHPLIWAAAQAQWLTGHRHEAVLAAAKAVNSALQSKLGRRDSSEQDLVRQAFSSDPPSPGRPRLRFLAIADAQTRESMRQGVMNFGAGCFGAIRNPLGHLPNDEVDLPEQIVVEQLAALSLLARWIDDADVVTS